VWIVDCNITQGRMLAYRAAGAQIVDLSHIDRDTLHERARSERPRLWHKLINEWQPAAAPTGSRTW
jgi:hypothetical protein